MSVFACSFCRRPNLTRKDVTIVTVKSETADGATAHWACDACAARVKKAADDKTLVRLVQYAGKCARCKTPTSGMAPARPERIYCSVRCSVEAAVADHLAEKMLFGPGRPIDTGPSPTAGDMYAHCVHFDPDRPHQEIMKVDNGALEVTDGAGKKHACRWLVLCNDCARLDVWERGGDLTPYVGGARVWTAADVRAIRRYKDEVS